MKSILHNKKKISFKLKAVLFLGISGLILSFYISLKYAGNSKTTYPALRFSNQLNPPVCEPDGGFYKDELSIKLEDPTSDLRIFYTLDGSEPKLSSPQYTHPILIEHPDQKNRLSLIPTSPRWMPPLGDVFKGTVLRAITVNAKNEKSAELVASFFLSEKGTTRYSLPVISISVNEKDFFGYNNGIYVLGKSYSDKDNYIRKNVPLNSPWWEYPSNYLLRGMDAERPAHIEFYEPSGKKGFSSNVGIRIHGNATRGFAQKSLRISFRKEYGPLVLQYDIFGRNKNYQMNSFILRNSGNDWDKTMFRDALMQTVMKNTNVDIQNYRHSVVFINGEYWGIHNIRERFDENYLSHKYHLRADSITILELSGKWVRGEKEDEKKFAGLLEFAKENDLSKDENYKYLSSKIDIGSFQDFIIGNVFFCNSDWPNNNVKFWRYNGLALSDTSAAGDGKWRWMLYDTDWGFGYNALSAPDIDLLKKASTVGSPGVLFSALQKNQQFRMQFVKRFEYLLNTSFAPEQLLMKIDRMQAELAPEMQEHIDRWRAIESYSKWMANVDVLRDFARERAGYQVDQLNAFFKLGPSDRITLKKWSKTY